MSNIGIKTLKITSPSFIHCGDSSELCLVFLVLISLIELSDPHFNFCLNQNIVGILDTFSHLSRKYRVTRTGNFIKSVFIRYLKTTYKVIVFGSFLFLKSTQIEIIFVGQNESNLPYWNYPCFGISECYFTTFGIVKPDSLPTNH